MPSLEESRRQVKEGLKSHEQELDHQDILASLQNEIDRHNAVKDGLRNDVRSRRHERPRSRSRERSVKFRFKDGVSDPRKRKHRRHNDERSSRHKRRRAHYPTPPDDDVQAAHPFPREHTTSFEEPAPGSGDTAFQTSLFDALADDEGAQYWESVYSQPIHIYARPSSSGPQGELEQMNDEEYAAYVKTKMWERQHPEIVMERERSAKQKREEEEERTRRREEHVRRRQRQAWERAEKESGRRFGGLDDNEDSEDDDHEPEFTGEPNFVADKKSKKRQQAKKDYEEAWSRYLSAWDELKNELLAETSTTDTVDRLPASKRIPWPVLVPTLPVARSYIDDFIRHAPAEIAKMRLQVLKAERVRWHPDKVQQRFGGTVDEGTMKLVTGVFQVVDEVFEEIRKQQGS